MSLVYFYGVASATETIALIKEKTGLELIYGSGSNDLYSCQVKFPDMENYETLEMMKPGGGESNLCFVDVENHFFAYVVPKSDTNKYLPGSAIEDWLPILIHEKDGELVSTIRGHYLYMRTYCNIPEYIDNTLKEQITLIPLYMSFGRSFVKNAYVNYERLFQPGLKFIDQNGNKFVTLGSYLLYKVD